MWYFTRVLGLTMAILLSVVNTLWFELQEARDQDRRRRGILRH